MTSRTSWKLVMDIQNGWKCAGIAKGLSCAYDTSFSFQLADSVDFKLVAEVLKNIALESKTSDGYNAVREYVCGPRLVINKLDSGQFSIIVNRRRVLIHGQYGMADALSKELFKQLKNVKEVRDELDELFE